MPDSHTTGSDRVKRGLAEMLKGGVIMDVVTAAAEDLVHLALICWPPMKTTASPEPTTCGKRTFWSSGKLT